MQEVLIWLYIATAVLLFVHEVDSGYWKEWELFRMPGGPGFFMILHIPVFFLFFAGLVLLVRGNYWGMIASLVLAAGSIGGFTIHTIFIAKGDRRFGGVVSRGILWLMLFSGITLGAITILLLV
ncbi:MAG: hypothetical protein HPY53_17155 [Brevinematales bacterium]|nr:hypothetical protein [Brevinematales bacterium]